MSFKWTEKELQAVAQEMYKMLTARRSAILEYRKIFKIAQQAVNPTYKYSTETIRKPLMDELKRRVDALFVAACAPKTKKPKLTDEEAFELLMKKLNPEMIS